MYKCLMRSWLRFLLAVTGVVLCAGILSAGNATSTTQTILAPKYSRSVPYSRSAERLLAEFGLTDFAEYFLPATKVKDKACGAMALYLRAAERFEAGNYKTALELFEKAHKLDPDDPSIFFGVARCQAMMLQYDATRETCDKVLARSPQFVPALILKAVTFDKQGNYAAASAGYEQALLIEPKNRDALEALGVLYFQRLSNYEKSIELFERLVEVAPRNNVALIYLGSLYALKGDIDKSVAYYDRVIRLYPTLIGKYVQLGIILEENRKPEGALKVYRKVLGLQPDNTEAQRLLDVLVTRLFGRDAILKQYEEIAQNYPDAIDVQQLYASKLIAFGKYGDARQQLERILRLDPENVDSYLKLGALTLLEGNKDEAHRFFARATEIEAGNIDTFLRIADLLRSQKQDDAALSYLEKALEVEPGNVPTRVRMAETYRQMKQYEKAEKMLQTLAAEQPKNAQLHASLGDLYQAEEKNDLAIEAYKKALELAPQNLKYFSPLAYLYLARDDVAAVEQTRKQLAGKLDSETEANLQLILGRLYSEFGKLEKTRDAFAEYVKAQPKSLSGYGALASAENRLRRYDEALAVLERAKAALGKDAESPEFLVLRGLTYFDQRKYQDALREFDEAVRLDPNDFEAYRSSILALKKLGQYDEIATCLQKMRTLFAEKKQDLDELTVDILTAQKKFADAESLLRPLIEAEPKNEDLYYLLANVYYEARQYDKAEETYRKVLEINPENVDAYNNLGYMFAERGVRLEEAEGLIKTALKKRPFAGYIIDSLAWVYYKRGEYEKAQKYFQKALSLDFEDPTLFDHVGDTYKKMGDKKQAQAFWKRALELEPDNRQEIEAKVKALK